ncbi:MAG: MipA/OmpV family protein [Arenicellales bacterium]
MAAYPAAEHEQVAPPYARQQGWSLGALLLVVDRPYRGAGTRVLAVPAVGYEGKYLFLQGIRFGVHVKRSRRFTFDVLLQPRFSSFDASDVKNVPGLENRRDSVDAGFNTRVGLGDGGALVFTGLTDILGRSNGQELDFRYEYPFRLGRARITPSLGARWLSASFTNYYYGTLSGEVARGAPDYRPGAVVLPQIGIGVFAPIAQTQWRVFAFFNTSFLPARLRDSPLIGADTASTLVTGMSYHF